MRRVLTALSSTLLAAALLAAASPHAAGEPPSAVPHGDGRVVTLPTGHRILLHTTAEGPATVSQVPGSPWPAADPVVVATMHGEVYAIPRSVIPYFGQQLDQSLFDVARLSGTSSPTGRDASRSQSPAPRRPG